MPDVPFALSRRHLLGSAGALTGAAALPSLLGGCASAATPASGTAEASARTRRWCIRNAHVITMVEGEADRPDTDILIEHGRISRIGSRLDTDSGVTDIDGKGQIVLPGLIDTHNHMWQTQMRGMFAQHQGALFFPLTKRYASLFSPEDTRIGMQFAATENVAAGITTSNDFFDNNRSPEHARAALEGYRRGHQRVRLLYGMKSKTTEDIINLDDMETLARRWADHAKGAPLSLGMAWRLPTDLNDAAQWAKKDREYQKARALGLPISVHISGEPHHRMFQEVIDRGYLFKALQLIHATDARTEHLAAMNAAGASLALTPITEQRVAYGLTRVSHFNEVKRLGLGIDGNSLAGNANLFEVMKVAALTELGASGSQTSVDCRHLLSLVTSRAAAALGMEDQIGTLTSGKKADLIMIDPRTLNMGMMGDDPAAALVFSATPANVSLVAIDGRIRKQHHQLLDTDIPTLLDEVNASIARLKQAAGAA